MNADIRARRRYARKLKPGDLVKFVMFDKVTEAPFIAVAPDKSCVAVRLQRARKYASLTSLILPATPPREPKKKKAKPAHSMPAALRRRLGIGAP